MDCPRCATANPEGAKFCLNCGTALAMACPQCGAVLTPRARFCTECGARVVPPTREVPLAEPDAFATRFQRLVPKEYAERLLATRGQVAPERRTVTILFSDVKGSTAMAEDLDPEDVLEIMDGAFDFLIQPIYRYEGTLARLMGDAVLAFFGAPLAHEDDAQRACLAALEITAQAQRYAARIEKEKGIAGFDVRVGIHTGLVVVGEVGSDLRVEYTAMGDAINVAARMEGAAEPGTVLVSEATHKLIAPLFETESLGPIRFKGKRKPVRVWRVLAARRVPGKVRGIAGLESPLVGREAEFRALRAALERMQNGVGGIVTVVGEAGIGKSRLVAEVRKVGATHLQGDGPSPFARALHLRWVEGRCLSYGRSIAYLLWLDVLRGLLGVTVEDAPAVVRDALEERVRALFPDSFDPVEEAVYPCLARLLSLPLAEEAEVRLEELDGRELRDCTFGALEAVLAWAAQEQPLVLVCEDLHWADPTSLQLLEHLLPLAEQHPLLILCLLRPVRDHGSWRLREVILQEHAQRHTALWLEPLSVGESEMLVGNLLWIESLSAELKKTILSRAEGNPFYLEEILRSLIDQGAIVQDPASGRWQPLADVERIAIPGTLEGVLVARIDRLHEKTRRVLQLASVIGRIFPYRILAAIAKEERELDRRLLTLQQEEMIRERARLPELEYIFKHDLTREAAYNGLLKRDRRVYHRQVAEALERLFPERAEEQLGLLAHHWERAGDAEKAVEYLLQAGDRARRLYAHQEAIRAYERALVRLKEQGDHEQAARTMMKLGLAHHNAFQFQQSRQAYDEGFALWRRAGEVQAAVGHLPAPHALRLFWYDLPTLDWALHQTVENSAQLEHLFSGLVALTPELDVVPDVARSWEVLDGGRKYLFHLRDDVHWSDGVPVTAGDFEYAWRRLLNPGTSLEIVSMLDAVAGAKALHRGDVADPASLGVCALDDRTLLVELEGPTAHFLQLLAEYTAFPVPRHALEAHGEAWVKLENIVTNGPFRLEAWQRGESMVLVRNPNYHGPFTGNVERIELCLLPLAEWPEILQRYQDDRLDVLLRLWFLPPEQRNRTQQHYAGEALSIPALHTGAVWFNGKRPPFSDVNVRRAFVLAADRKALLDAVWPDWTPASGGFIPPSMPGHSPGIALSYDPQKARKLLADAGYPAARGFPTLRALTWHGAEPTMEYLQDQWRENLGIEMQWDAVPFGELWDESHEKQVHVWSFAWQADYPDPDNFLRAGQRGCLTGWCSEAYDRLVEEARRSMDQAKRMKLFGQADRILMEDAVLMPYCHARWKLLVKPWVKRYPTSPMRQWFWKDVVIEPH